MGDDSAVDIMCGLRNQSLESNISKVFETIISFQLRVPKGISELVTGWKSNSGFFSKLIHISFTMGHQCIRKEEGGQTTCFGSQSMQSEYVWIKPVAYTHHLLRFWWYKWKTHWIILMDNVCSVIMDNSDDFDNLVWTRTTGKQKIKESFCSSYQVTLWLSQ